MTIFQTTLASAIGVAFLFVSGSDVGANGCWDCDPEPPPTVEPEPEVTPTLPSSGGSVYDSASEVFYGTCYCDGRYTVSKMPSLRSPEFREKTAREQCEVLNRKRSCAITDDDVYTGPLK